LTTKWTSNAQNGTKFKGWDEEGIERFNTIGGKIERRRKVEETGESLEGRYREEMKKMKGKKRKDRLSEPDRKVKPRCDLPEGFQMEAI
jgi:hypothetical protein